MKYVYVVSWDYNTGGGFDWYHRLTPATKAFNIDRLNVDYLKAENYISYLSIHLVPDNITNEEVTDIIDTIVNSDKFIPVRINN